MQEGRVIELSVIFADLTSFTEMTNRLGPERSYDVVNAFFNMAGEILIKNDAFIDKYIGDAVMAIFNAPIQNAKHARGATTAALGILEGLKSVSKTLGLDLQARVGVATGYARVGRLGSTDRKDYTAIGDVVNLASRLEALAKPGEVLVDGKAFVQVAEDYPDLIPEELNVRGFAEPVEVYRIGKFDRENAAISVQQPDQLTMRQRVSFGTVLFSIFGAPCAVVTTLSPLAIIVGLTDAFDAMTSTRPYREGMPIIKALTIIEECAGTQFDTELSHAFIQLGKEGALNHIVGHSDLGIPMQDCPECGPIIVVRRDQKTGDYVFCRNCSYKTTVIREDGRITIAETDDHGTAEELQPEVDMLLVQELIAEAARVLG
jgi:class 3 adenylate cyclase